MSEDWASAAPRVEMSDGGHFHEPVYPSCVVCRMRDLEREVAQLVEQLKASTEELNRWGMGDFHYGSQPQDPEVVFRVKAATALLASLGESPTP